MRAHGHVHLIRPRRRGHHRRPRELQSPRVHPGERLGVGVGSKGDDGRGGAPFAAERAAAEGGRRAEQPRGDDGGSSGIRTGVDIVHVPEQRHDGRGRRRTCASRGSRRLRRGYRRSGGRIRRRVVRVGRRRRSLGGGVGLIPRLIIPRLIIPRRIPRTLLRLELLHPLLQDLHESLEALQLLQLLRRERNLVQVRDVHQRGELPAEQLGERHALRDLPRPILRPRGDDALVRVRRRDLPLPRVIADELAGFLALLSWGARAGDHPAPRRRPHGRARGSRHPRCVARFFSRTFSWTSNTSRGTPVLLGLTNQAKPSSSTRDASSSLASS